MGNAAFDRASAEGETPGGGEEETASLSPCEEGAIPGEHVEGSAAPIPSVNQLLPYMDSVPKIESLGREGHGRTNPVDESSPHDLPSRADLGPTHRPSASCRGILPEEHGGACGGG